MKSLLLLLAIFLMDSAISQVHYRILNHNNASVSISDAGTFFQDFNTNGHLGYEIPKDSGIRAIYATSFWFGGITSTGDTSYVLGGNPSTGTDVFNGPYSVVYDDPTYQSDWDSSIWMFTQEEIENFKFWWEACNGPNANQPDCSDAVLPSNETLIKLYSWPGNGNVAIGEAYWLAPYWDYNSDGTYDPSDGDYPLLKGCKSVYLIQNDDAGIKTLSGTSSLGLEIHYMFYQYRTWDYLNDVTFVDVVAINRGSNNY
ncbi:MAG: hypothetical protein JKY09_07860, partial [Crocinitomicaceae bacterium]|nr:hypothetical protein [Crocinitomicaceae bacterium]